MDRINLHDTHIDVFVDELSPVEKTALDSLSPDDTVKAVSLHNGGAVTDLSGNDLRRVLNDRFLSSRPVWTVEPANTSGNQPTHTSGNYCLCRNYDIIAPKNPIVVSGFVTGIMARLASYELMPIEEKVKEWHGESVVNYPARFERLVREFKIDATPICDCSLFLLFAEFEKLLRSAKLDDRIDRLNTRDPVNMVFSYNSTWGAKPPVLNLSKDRYSLFAATESHLRLEGTVELLHELFHSVEIGLNEFGGRPEVPFNGHFVYNRFLAYDNMHMAEFYAVRTVTERPDIASRFQPFLETITKNIVDGQRYLLDPKTGAFDYLGIKE